MGIFGESVVKFKDQDYGKLRKNSINSKQLFEDPLFSPNESSIGIQKQLGGTVVWKRPPEFCDNPQLFVEKASSKDVTQGRLGNCWFVAACSALATVKSLWSQVIPNYKLQEWDKLRPETYGGIFHFRFWRFGQWLDVVVDDLLPTVNGELIFCHSSTENEFWSALLEKAYAKLCGSYGAMESGNLADALTDFTSGLSQMIELKNNGYEDETKRNELRKILLHEHEEHSLMSCAIVTNDSSLFESRTKNGLVLGHAYGITSVKEINVGSTSLFTFFKEREKLTLLRLRNPWGAKEWTGSFSDSSPEWAKISKSEKEKLGLTFEDDGEFWIPFEDFIVEFSDLCICHLINTSYFNFKKKWAPHSFRGEWSLPNNAGGCLNHDTFLDNPQYCLDIFKDKTELVVYLVQTDMRGKWVKNTEFGKSRYRSIGFHIMKVEQNRKYKTHRLAPKAATSDYVMCRSVYYNGELNKGRYILLPTTFEPRYETEYHLSVFSDEAIRIRKLVKDVPSPLPYCGLCCPMPMCVTIITVNGATGLSKPDDTYCIIRAERDKLKSEVVYGSNSPEWGLQGVFYRNDVCKPIFVELWGKRLVRDKFLGCGVIAESSNSTPKSISSPLVGRGINASERHPGEIQCTILTYDDLTKA